MAVSGSSTREDDAVVVAAAAAVSSAPSSPRNKVKFLCSQGGKILPRPSDGHLKYVGGETRVVSVPRDISFSELMKKLSDLFEGDMVLKYQLAAEDLDALVSVKSDEDLKHMLDEHDRHAGDGTPMLRAFLFPSVPTVIESPGAASLDPHALEQRYIDAVNGVILMNAMSPGAGAPMAAFGPYSPGQATFSMSSACSSPKSASPDCNPEYSTSQEASSGARNYHGNSPFHHPLGPIHKVHSSPSLYGLGNVPNGAHLPGSAPGHQQYSNHYYALNHHYPHHNQHQHQHHQHQYLTSYHPPRLVLVGGSGPDRLAPAPSLGRADIGKSPLNQGVGSYHHTGKSYRAGGYSNFGYPDEYYGNYSCRRPDRADSLPQSPRAAAWEGPSYKGEQS